MILLYENDYIMRMLKQISIILAKIIANKKIKNYEVCHNITDETLKNLYGINRDLLMKLPVRSIIDLICGYDGIQGEIVFSLSQLLTSEGEIFEEESNLVQSKVFYKKSLELLDFIDEDDNDPQYLVIRESKDYLMNKLSKQ